MGSTFYPRLPCVMIEKGANQAIATGTFTELSSWSGTEEVDNYSIHAASSSDFIVPVTGIYWIGAVLTWASESGGDFRQAWIIKNGTAITSERDSGGNTADFSSYTPISTILSLVKGDIISVGAQHDRGSNTSVLSNSWFGMIMLSKS